MSGGKVVESGEVFDVFAHPQHAFTQQLVSHTLNLTLPERLREHLPGAVAENFVYRRFGGAAGTVGGGDQVWRRGQYPAWQD